MVHEVEQHRQQRQHVVDAEREQDRARMGALEHEAAMRALQKTTLRRQGSVLPHQYGRTSMTTRERIIETQNPPVRFWFVGCGVLF
jgi:hypothetical protein